jgi:hypothetical protein
MCWISYWRNYSPLWQKRKNLMEQKTIVVKTNKGLQEVTGEVIKFKDYNEFEFIAHKSPDNPSLWLITEATTGLMLPQQYQCNNKKEAVTQAEIMLQSTTQSTLRDVIRKSLIKIVYINEN